MERKITDDANAPGLAHGVEKLELDRVKAILSEQRKAFLEGLRANFQSYLTYKFEVVATKHQLDKIHDALADFDMLPIPESLCRAALKNGMNAHNWFYEDVNQIISSILRPAQIEIGADRGRVKDGIDTTDLNTLSR